MGNLTDFTLFRTVRVYNRSRTSLSLRVYNDHFQITMSIKFFIKFSKNWKILIICMYNTESLRCRSTNRFSLFLYTGVFRNIS